MYKEQYADCLEYINNYWERIIYKPSRMKLRYGINNIPILLTTLNAKLIKKQKISRQYIEIPHYFFVPNDSKFKNIFYWDSYFMSKGLYGTKREWLMKEMVDNFKYLFEILQIIPNFSASAALGRSQPPFLSSMILDTYLAPLNPLNNFRSLKGLQANIYKIRNKNWLRSSIKIAKQEYVNVWIDKEKQYNHSVDGSELSRYGDRDIGYAHSSELESGWDMTSRFYNRCNEFFPIDLNTYLYKYELDFIKSSTILKDTAEFEYWTQKADQRKKYINKYMWNETEGLYFDFGFILGKQSKFLSLAGFTPMWAGLADPLQAEKMVKKLIKFETPFGLTITAKESLAKPIELSNIESQYHPAIDEIIAPKQWDYPNIWSPLEYLTIIGLLRYGYIEDARRIMDKSVKAHAHAFRKHKTFFEKLNGETGESGSGALYGDQDGFGWTNAVFFRYIQILDSLRPENKIYTQPLPQNPPYDLSIIH